jgi:hypothetical protein
MGFQAENWMAKKESWFANLSSSRAAIQTWRLMACSRPQLSLVDIIYLKFLCCKNMPQLIGLVASPEKNDAFQDGLESI